VLGEPVEVVGIHNDRYKKAANSAKGGANDKASEPKGGEAQNPSKKHTEKASRHSSSEEKCPGLINASKKLAENENVDAPNPCAKEEPNPFGKYESTFEGIDKLKALLIAKNAQSQVAMLPLPESDAVVKYDSRSGTTSTTGDSLWVANERERVTRHNRMARLHNAGLSKYTTPDHLRSCGHTCECAASKCQEYMTLWMKYSRVFKPVVGDVKALGNSARVPTARRS